MRTLLTAIFSFAIILTAKPCSSVIVTPQHSAEGCTMLWKHRDQTTTIDTRVAHFEGGRYSYTALVNSYYDRDRRAYAGVNEVGLGIISTATKNLNVRNRGSHSAPRVENRYGLIVEALRECATVDEFEALLKSRVRSAHFQSNIGVGDASGGAAYFEIWSDGYVRYDVKERPLGYDIRTNFSFAGDDSKRGASERRYRTVDVQMREKGVYSSADFIAMSRSFYSADKGGDILSNDDVYKEANYTVPRYSSVGATVVVCGKNPRIDVIVGHPVAGFAIPVWVECKHHIPKCLASRAMFDLSRKFSAAAYKPHISGKGYTLNKEVARKALKVKTSVKYTPTPPSDIEAFNASVDKCFEEHRSRMERVLRL